MMAMSGSNGTEIGPNCLYQIGYLIQGVSRFVTSHRVIRIVLEAQSAASKYHHPTEFSSHQDPQVLKYNSAIRRAFELYSISPVK